MRKLADSSVLLKVRPAERLDKKASFRLLQSVNSEFDPPLESSVDLESFAAKLASNAYFCIATYRGEFVGVIAYYRNDLISQIYITQVCVPLRWRGYGIARRMFGNLQDLYREKYMTFGLEVRKNNAPAISLYLGMGFTMKEDRGYKILMEVPLVLKSDVPCKHTNL